MIQLTEFDEVVQKLDLNKLTETFNETLNKYQDSIDRSPEINLAKSICDNYTRLLLSITPYKAKEFVEKNCARVTDKIITKITLCKIAKLIDIEKENKQ